MTWLLQNLLYHWASSEMDHKHKECSQPPVQLLWKPVRWDFWWWCDDSMLLTRPYEYWRHWVMSLHVNCTFHMHSCFIIRIYILNILSVGNATIMHNTILITQWIWNYCSDNSCDVICFHAELSHTGFTHGVTGRLFKGVFSQTVALHHEAHRRLEINDVTLKIK